MPLPWPAVLALAAIAVGTFAIGLVGDIQHWDRPFLVNLASAACGGSVSVILIAGLLESGRRKQASLQWLPVVRDNLASFASEVGLASKRIAEAVNSETSHDIPTKGFDRVATWGWTSDASLIAREGLDHASLALHIDRGRWTGQPLTTGTVAEVHAAAAAMSEAAAAFLASVSGSPMYADVARITHRFRSGCARFRTDTTPAPNSGYVAELVGRMVDEVRWMFDALDVWALDRDGYALYRESIQRQREHELPTAADATGRGILDWTE